MTKDELIKGIKIERLSKDKTIFAGAQFENARLEYLRGADFINMKFLRSHLTETISEARIKESSFFYCEIMDCYNSVLSNVSFNYCSFAGLRDSPDPVRHRGFMQSRLYNVKFANCNLKEVMFTLVRFENVKFINCNLANVYLKGIDLERTTFENCNTEGMVTGAVSEHRKTYEEFYKVCEDSDRVFKDSED